MIYIYINMYYISSLLYHIFTIWSANKSTVFNVNLRLQKLNRSSSEAIRMND